MEKSIKEFIKEQQISQEIQQEKQPKSSSYIPGEKKGKWSYEENLKYIVYIDFYKQKIRSRQRKRSNKFYKRMSDFIGTRNGLQCRSHHQKLEQKYIYTSKIIAAYKEKFDIERYREELNQLKQIKNFRHSNKSDLKSEECPMVSVKQTKDIQTQTDLQGINFNYIVADQTAVFLYPPVSGVPFNSGAFFYPSSLTLQQQNMFSFADSSLIRRQL